MVQMIDVIEGDRASVLVAQISILLSFVYEDPYFSKYLENDFKYCKVKNRYMSPKRFTNSSPVIGCFAN